MEFLDISFTKNLSLLIYTIYTVPWILQKSAKQENLNLFTNSIWLKGKIRIETRQKLESEKTICSSCPETSTENAVQEFHLNLIYIK
jgi:hypothetical protein